jgi:predicted XRE-type DNA-binding protein
MADHEVQNLMNQLLAWLNEKGVSQAELSRQLGVRRQRVNDWLTGRTIPRLQEGLKIQAFLKKQKRMSKPRGPR